MNFNVTIPNWGCWIITICFIVMLVIRILKMIPPEIRHKFWLFCFYHNSETYRTGKIAERERVGSVRLRSEESHRVTKREAKLKEKLKMTDNQKRKD